jgi:hypothetical protein
MISSLFTRLLLLAYTHPNAQLMKPPGAFGKTSASACTLTRNLSSSPIPVHFCNFLRFDTAQEPWLPAALQCILKRWRASFAPWDRHFPHWDAPIPGSLPTANLTSDCRANSQLTQNQTLPHNRLNQYPWPS